MKKRKHNKTPHAKWTREEVNILVEKLLDAKDRGLSSENGFKSAVWSAIASAFTDPLKQATRVCESKWTRLKKEYKEVKELREASGFGWDAEGCLPTATDEVWEGIAKVGIGHKSGETGL